MRSVPPTKTLPPYLKHAFITLSKDVDECSEDKHNCSSKAACENTVGSFECKCNDGYQVDEKTCLGERLFILLEHESETITFGNDWILLVILLVLRVLQ